MRSGPSAVTAIFTAASMEADVAIFVPEAGRGHDACLNTLSAKCLLSYDALQRPSHTIAVCRDCRRCTIAIGDSIGWCGRHESSGDPTTGSKAIGAIYENSFTLSPSARQRNLRQILGGSVQNSVRVNHRRSFGQP